MNIFNNEEENENVLEKYGRNITELAKARKIDPVIGRDEECCKPRFYFKLKWYRQ